MSFDGDKRKRFGSVVLWIASVGPLIWIAWSIYSICLWWMTPSSPNQTHIMQWTEHGRSHYLTADQYSFYSHFQTAGCIGLVEFFVLLVAGALILRPYDAKR